jgi:hypothetical protein
MEVSEGACRTDGTVTPKLEVRAWTTSRMAKR